MILLASVAAVFTGCTQVGDFFDFRPPADVTGHAGVALDRAAELTWSNPSDDDFSHVRVSWGNGQESFADDGEERTVIEGLSNGSEYLFKLHAVDRAGNESPGVEVSVTPVAATTYTLSVAWDSFAENAVMSSATGPGVRTASASDGTNVTEAVRNSSQDGAGGFGGRAPAGQGSVDPPPGVLVKYRDPESGGGGTDGPPSRIREQIRSRGTERALGRIRDARISKILPDASGGRTVDEILAYYNSLPEVEYAERDAWVYALDAPNDPYYASYQWNFQRLSVPAAWDLEQGQGDSQVVVAVIDTGIDQGLSDFATTSFVQGRDVVNGDDDATDDDGHGSHVAGTVAQSTGNGVGVAGFAPGVSLMAVKVLPPAPEYGTLSDVIEGIMWAVDNGADVINLSLGAEGSTASERDAVEYAYQNGVVVVAAAGNSEDGTDPVSYPAAYDDFVLAVGATQLDDSLAPYSNTGPELDVVAPGGNTGVDLDGNSEPDGILQQTIAPQSAARLGTNYYWFQGTSMAAPHVAGLAALMLSQDQTLTPSSVFSLIRYSADDLGDAGFDNSYGHGLINPLAALGTVVYPRADEISDEIHGNSDAADYWDISATGGLFDIQLTFVHAEADLQVSLWGPGGEELATAQTQTDNEVLSHDAGGKPGTYTIEVRVAE